MNGWSLLKEFFRKITIGGFHSFLSKNIHVEGTYGNYPSLFLSMCSKMFNFPFLPAEMNDHIDQFVQGQEGIERQMADKLQEQLNRQQEIIKELAYRLKMVEERMTTELNMVNGRFDDNAARLLEHGDFLRSLGNPGRKLKRLKVRIAAHDSQINTCTKANCGKGLDDDGKCPVCGHSVCDVDPRRKRKRADSPRSLPPSHRSKSAPGR